MAGKIDVFLRTGERPHSIYRSLLSHPPHGVRYVAAWNGRDAKAPSALHGMEVSVFNLLRAFFPPAAYVNPRGAALVHSTNNILVANRHPWVVDTESAEGLMGFRNPSENPLVFSCTKKLLSAESCKAVLPWSNAARQAIANAFPQEVIRKKLALVRPAVELPGKRRRRRHGGFRLLFVGRLFFEKGGRETLTAFSALKKRYDVSLAMVADIPTEYRKAAAKSGASVFPPRLTSGQMSRLFSAADLLVFPTYMDTFGAVVLEALSHGLPVVSSTTYCVPEMVQSGRTGILLEPPVKWHGDDMLFQYGRWRSYREFAAEVKAADMRAYAAKVRRAVEALLVDGALYRRMSANARAASEKGPFSIRARNEALGKVYESCIAHSGPGQ